MSHSASPSRRRTGKRAAQVAAATPAQTQPRHIRMMGLRVSTRLQRNAAGQVTCATLSITDSWNGDLGYGSLVAWPDRPATRPSCWLTSWGLYGPDCSSCSMQFIADLMGWGQVPKPVQAAA